MSRECIDKPRRVLVKIQGLLPYGLSQANGIAPINHDLLACHVRGGIGCKENGGARKVLSSALQYGLEACTILDSTETEEEGVRQSAPDARASGGYQMAAGAFRAIRVN
jgi:hypothetical protein